MSLCPHGDSTCPCQDPPDSCHFEGPQPWPCPTWAAPKTNLNGWVTSSSVGPHCHMGRAEGGGCSWPEERCALLLMARERPAGGPSLDEAYELSCGMARRLSFWPRMTGELPPPLGDALPEPWREATEGPC